MFEIEVLLKSNPYSIFIGQNINQQLMDKIFKQKKYDQIFILAQKSIIQYTKQIFSDSKVHIIYLKEDENIKNITYAEKIIQKLADKKCSRNSLLIGFGGGTVTDFTGFIASVFMRGIDHIFIPTTLLSMVDASIGGKTGLNIKSAKNLIGTFKQPKGVFINPLFLHSLDKKQIINGFAEIIKYALIFDKTFYYEITKNFSALIELNNTNDIEHIIKKCCEFKRDIIMQDEFEENKRMLLNFGHTIGHAIETYYDYKKILHGEAVYYGMSGAAFISYKLSYLKEKEFYDITNFIHSIKKYPLKNIKDDTLFSFLKNDKKRIGNKSQFVLLNNIGDAMIKENVNHKIIKDAIQFINN